MANIWPTTKADGEVVPDEEWNGIVDLGVQKPSAAALNTNGIVFASASNTVKTVANLTLDAINNRIGVGTSTPLAKVHVKHTAQPDIIFQSVAGDTGQKFGKILYDGRDGTLTGGGWVWQALTDAGAFSANLMVLTQATGRLGLGTLEPETLLHLAAADSVMTLTETNNTPANPTANVSGRIYFRGDKIVFQWNDAGTTRYKSLLLTGTGVTWAHSTTAP